MLLLFRSAFGTTAPGLNLSLALSDLLPKLQAADFSALNFWTEAELYAFADEGAKRLARVMGGFVEHDSTIAVGVGTHTYTFPARHVSTIHMSLGSRALRPRTSQELESLDSAWVDTESATVLAWIQNQIGTEQFRAYPKPAAGAAGNFGITLHRYPVEITASAAIIQAPVCVREWFLLYVLGEARAKESKGAMPEVAQWCGQVTAMLEQVFREYWGGAQ